MTYAEFNALHPLSEYRDAEWRAWEDGPGREYKARGWFDLHNPVPTMEALALMPPGPWNAWTIPWLKQQEAARREAEGEPTIEEERLAQAQADRASREVFRQHFLDPFWVQANM